MSNVKISDLPVNNSPSTDALVEIVNNPSSNPISQATPIASLVGSILTFKSYSFTSQGILAGVHFIGGYYNAPAADANLDEGSPSVNLGSANVAYAAHVFIVPGAAGTVNAGNVGVRVSGTSITDDGVRTAGDTELITNNITALSANQYLETSKKFIGGVTIALVAAGGATTYSLDFNYGFAKYEDFNNQDFTVNAFEAVGLAGANDTSFNIELLLHDGSGWTYDAAAFEPGGTVICSLTDDHVTEDNLANNVEFAYKRSNLSTAVSGSASEGVVIRVTAGANNSVQAMDAHIGVTF